LIPSTVFIFRINSLCLGDFESVDSIQICVNHLHSTRLSCRSCLRTTPLKDDLILPKFRAHCRPTSFQRDGYLCYGQSLLLRFVDFGLYNRTEPHMRYSWLPRRQHIVLWRQFLLRHTIIVHYLCCILQARSKLQRLSLLVLERFRFAVL
jgi:hypothetical protein